MYAALSQPRRVAPIAALALLLASACEDSTAPGTGGPVVMSFVASGDASASGTSGAAATSTGTVVAVGADTLRLTSVKLIIDEVELYAGTSSDCSGDASGGTIVVNPGCAELEVGPFLVDLSLTGGTSSPITVQLPAGTYRKLEMKLRRADSGDDRAFNARHPEMSGITVLAQGSYRGVPFTWRGDVEADLEMYFAQAMAVDGGGSFTVNIDVGRWFRTGAGAIIDPSLALAGQAGYATVAQNIRASFGVFEDDDRDGRDDHRGRRDD